MFLIKFLDKKRGFEGINTLLSLLLKTKFSSARQVKNHNELFSTFLDESREVKC